MNKFTIYTLLLLMLLSCTPQKTPTTQESPPLVSFSSPSTARGLQNPTAYALYTNGKFAGTCFAVRKPSNNDIIILTALHNVSLLDTKDIASLSINNAIKIKKLLKDKSESDIALLEPASTAGLVPLKIEHTPGIGMSITSISNSYFSYLNSVKQYESRGYVLFYDTKFPDGFFCYLNLFDVGGSGAPILDSNGALRGMATQRSIASNKTEYTGVIYAISSDTITRFLSHF